MMEEVAVAEESNGDFNFEFVDEGKMSEDVVVPPVNEAEKTPTQQTAGLIAITSVESLPTESTPTFVPVSPQIQLPPLGFPINVSPLVEQSNPLDKLEEASQGVWGWFSNNNLINKITEKAKNSVDSMITTLDPGMKEFIYSGGDIDIVVASEKDAKVCPVREAFQAAFGHATVCGAPVPPTQMAPQPQGFSAAVKSAEERISAVKFVGQESQAIVAVEGFIVELVTERWYEMSCLILRDKRFQSDLHVFTQPTPIPPEFIAWIQDATPSNYPLSWSGFPVTIGAAAQAVSGLDPGSWQESIVGISRRDLISMAAKTLAAMYKAALERLQ